MTNVSRKLIAFIVGLCFALLSFGALAWATSGFRNWDAASWFNYWGQGKPSVTRIAEQPAEQYATALTSADNSLTLDSDDTELTAEVKKFPTPEFYMDNDIFGWGMFYDPADKSIILPKSIEVYVDTCRTTAIIGVNHLSLSSSKAFCGLIYEFSDFELFVLELVENFEDNLDFSFLGDQLKLGFSFPCSETDGYLESDMFFNSYYFPDPDYCHFYKPIVMDGTKVKVYMPYDYAHISPAFGKAGLRRKLIIDIFEDIVSDDWLNSTPAYSLNGSGSMTYFDGNSDFVTDSSNPFTLHTEESRKHYYEIDLSKLNFVNTVHYACAIRVSTFWSVLNPDKNSVTPDYILHPFAVKTYTDDFHGHLNFAIEKLAAPQNLTYNFGKLSWDEVNGAQGYAVFDGDNSWTVDTNSISLPDSTLTSGEHIFRVRALGNVGHTLTAADNGLQLSAYNASSNITQLVTLTYNINGDTLTKFVPLGSKLSDYIYDVNISGQEFGGWYYDDGLSRKVEPTDVLAGDTVIYARLSDKKVVDSKKPSWWSQYQWYVIGGLIGLVVLCIVAATVVGIRKKKAA